MGVKVSVRPRKEPQQARSRATVDAILRATARVLSRDGFDRMSTNKVAEVAGVAVGSLYQYFPSKEALVAELIDRHRAEMMAAFLERMRLAGDKPIRVLTPEIVRAVLDAHGVDPKLHHLLMEQIPRVGRLGALLEDLDGGAFEAVRACLEAHRDELRVVDVDRAAWVVVHTVETLVHRAVLGRGGDVDETYREIVDLILRYLLPDQRGGDGRGCARRGTGSRVR